MFVVFLSEVGKLCACVLAEGGEGLGGHCELCEWTEPGVVGKV